MQRPAKGIKITGVLGPCDPRCFDPGGCKEGSAMAPFAVRSSMPRTFLLVVGCVLACAFLQPAVALAQRAVAHPAAGGRVVSPRVLVPPVQPSAAHTTISRPRVFTGQRPARAEPDTFPFHQGPVKIFRHRVFFGPRFFWFGPAWWFNYGRWPNYCPYWSWGFDCCGSPFSAYGYGFHNYVILPTYEYPAYIYVPGDRDLVWLYLKDGTVYGVADYWFVNSEVHFITIEERGAKSTEEIAASDELDFEKTIDVNTRRGFRVVMRDEPLDQYLRDHPVTYAGKPRWSSTREPEGVFYDAFVASPIGIALENLEGRPPFASLAPCSRLGFSEEDLCRKHCVEFPPRCRNRLGALHAI